ncbi:hypothetical protein [Ruegeria arenilitoris]|uniref:hypothetical protein n=1 Tax=Ruegeria arenilitoris TaxID=1173585 RepID=UPI00147E206D|nr:hypothetical protein [Ruegeria arenilitoris]
MSKRDKLKRNRMKRYEDLALRRNYVEPMQYLFGQLKGAVDKGNHDKAIKIALFLIPFGHAKALPRKQDGDEVGTDRLTVNFTVD